MLPLVYAPTSDEKLPRYSVGAKALHLFTLPERHTLVLTLIGPRIVEDIGMLVLMDPLQTAVPPDITLAGLHVAMTFPYPETLKIRLVGPIRSYCCELTITASNCVVPAFDPTTSPLQSNPPVMLQLVGIMELGSARM